jgi:hypothetical protein
MTAMHSMRAAPECHEPYRYCTIAQPITGSRKDRLELGRFCERISVTLKLVSAFRCASLCAKLQAARGTGRCS